MSDHSARIAWQLNAGDDFVAQRYSRRHRLEFDGGAQVAGSSSPHSVPLPYSDAAAVDPEEMFVAALSSCHMLWFLSLAAQQGFVVQQYGDDAVGTLARGADGRIAMTVVTLRPLTVFAGDRQPSRAELDALHHQAHARCFIANSVNTEVRCQPQ